MHNERFDVVAFGTCYVDTNAENYPFASEGITSEVELIGTSYEIAPGGSAVNFCRLLGDFGLGTAFIGMVGDDQNADILAQLLERHNVQAALIRRPDLQTNIGFNMTNPEGAHIMLIAGTANTALTPEDVVPRLDQLLPEAKTLYLGGCFKLIAFEHAFAEIADSAKQHSAKLVVDHGRIPKGTSNDMLEAVKNLVLNATYYLPSREEFCKLWGVATIEEGLQQLSSQAPGLTVVVKDSTNGAFYWSDGSMKNVEAEKVDKVINATGAGDSFNAGVIAALTKGHDLPDAVAYGCRVAAAKIQAKPLPR